MKSVLISINPNRCEKILYQIGKDKDGKPIYEKCIDIRKSAPKEVPFKVFIYCTKMRKKDDLITKSENFGWIRCAASSLFNRAEEYDANGRVIGEFICDRIEMVNAKCSDYGIDLFYHDCLTKGGLTEREIEEYFNIPEDKDLRAMKGNGYAWYISDLKIYDKPKELSEFKTPPCDKPEKACGNCKWLVKINTPDVYECECYVEDGRPIIRPPQSWQYVEEI